MRAAAAAATGTDEPPLQELHRVSGTNLMMAIGTLIAVFALLSQVGSPQELWDTITSADLGLADRGHGHLAAHQLRDRRSR